MDRRDEASLLAGVARGDLRRGKGGRSSRGARGELRRDKAGRSYRAIGWDGKTLETMLNDSERLLSETGRYFGLDRLTAKESDPMWIGKEFLMLRGAFVIS